MTKRKHKELAGDSEVGKPSKKQKLQSGKPPAQKQVTGKGSHDGKHGVNKQTVSNNKVKAHTKWNKKKPHAKSKDTGDRRKPQGSKGSSEPAHKPVVSSNWRALLQTMKGGKEVHLKPKAIAQSNSKTEKAESRVKKAKDEIWFDDVDEAFLDRKSAKINSADDLVKSDSFKGLTKAVAMDCEMVGVGVGGVDSVLARVSLVNQYGHCLYDTFVKPKEAVTDYRTAVSGVRPTDLEHGEALDEVQQRVHSITKGRILVGHAIFNDLQVLFLDHPRKMIRDTQRFKPFRALFGGRNPSLKKLTEKVLKVDVQKGEHSSVEDAQATMRLYTMYKKQWEKEIAQKTKPTHKKKPVKLKGAVKNKSSLDG